MSNYTKVVVFTGGPITLPTGVTVGDEFRIAGRVRVEAVAAETIDTSQFADGTRFFSTLPGEVTVTLALTEAEVSE